MKKILTVLIIFAVFLLASCAMEDSSNSCTSLGATSVGTGAAHAIGIQGPGLKDGSFGSSWSGN